MRLVFHNDSDELPTPKPLENFTHDKTVEMEIDDVEISSTSSDINYSPDIKEELHIITQKLNDLEYLI